MPQWDSTFTFTLVAQTGGEPSEQKADWGLIALALVAFMALKDKLKRR